jgi:C1A family cysteine protease
LAVGGTNIFAGTENGVYLSTNNGNTWTAVNGNLKNLKVSTLAINGNTVFVGTQTDGIYLSTDNGTSWIKANSGLTNLGINAFAQSGSNIYVGTNGGVFISSNNGISWKALNFGLTSLIVRSLAIGGGYLFAGTYDGVWKVQLTEDPKFQVSGKVTNQAGKAIIGAVINGLPDNPMTDNDGNFVDSVSQGWSGKITPALNGYTFSPASRNYSNVIENKENQDFTGDFLSIRSIQVSPISITINQKSVSSTNIPSYSFLDNKIQDHFNSTVQDSPQITNHSMGCQIPDSIVEYWKSHEPAPVYLKSISTAIDWSNNDSPVKNQGGCGACWAFATAAFIENLGNQSDLSEQTLLSCAESGSCQGGYYEQALQFVQRKGIPDESCYPYIQQNGNCSNACSNPVYNEKIMIVSSSLWGIATVENLKAKLQNGPLIVTMKVPVDNTFDGVPGYQGGVYHYSGGFIPESRGHAILLVGYDENQKCFKAKNSWGNGWGENGYFRISYDDLTNEVQFGSYAINGSQVYTENLSNSLFTISNQGNDNLTVNSIQSDKDWLTVSGYPDGAFIVSPETSQSVSITVNWSKLGSVTQIGTITIESNDPDKPTVSIKVTAIPVCSSIVNATISYDSNLTICKGDYTVLNAGDGDDLIYQWKKNGVVIPDANGTSYIAIEGAAYTVEVTHVGTMCSSVSPAIALVVNPTPPPPTITLYGITMKSDHTVGNQWYDKNGLISGANNQMYSPTKSGDYYVVTTINGCNSNPSNTINYIMTGIEANPSNSEIKVYPNPVSDELIIESEGTNNFGEFEIINSLGQVVFTGILDGKTVVETSSFTPGIYLVKLKSGKSFELRKIVKSQGNE